MKKVFGIMIVVFVLFIALAGIGQESKHKMKAEVTINDVTLAQATDVERKLREIRSYGQDGKPIKIEINVKMD